MSKETDEHMTLEERRALMSKLLASHEGKRLAQEAPNDPKRKAWRDKMEATSEFNDRLGVYYAYWDQNGFGLSAVVVAGSDTEAVQLLELDESYETLERVSPFGMAFPGEKPHVVSRQSL